MSGIKNFILGFSLSLFSVILIEQTSSSATKEIRKLPQHDIKIDLFKKVNASVIPQATPTLFAEIKKQSLAHNDFSKPTVAPSFEGEDDDEILSVNVDGIIPIEYISSDFSSAEVLHQGDDNESAMLPETETDMGDSFNTDSPWVIAKGSKNIKNKKLLEQFNNKEGLSLSLSKFNQTEQENEATSYKVAERIKQSIIFPIPDEILSDENLTPTFVKSNAKTTTSIQKKRPKTTPKTEELKIISKESPAQESPSASKDTNILNSISSWFSEKSNENTLAVSPKKKRAAPTYSQSNKKSSENEQAPLYSDNEDLADFYETLQETKAQHDRKVVPSELKMSFQPERAEISGSTLQWLKIFSEATRDSDTYLEVRLDASASDELQKKRLSLLYSVFTNNGVDFSKINTIFSSTEPNTFIIRVIRSK